MSEAPALSEDAPPSSPLDQSMSSINDNSNASDSPDRPGRAQQPLKLLTADFDGKIVALRLIVNAAIYQSPPGFAPQDSFIGHDGNKFYCQVCKELGEIVCCDGCPRAYHPECLPEQGESRISLLRDDDPWFCPVCYESKETPPDHEQGPSIPYEATAHLQQQDKKAIHVPAAEEQQDIKMTDSHAEEEMHVSVEEEDDHSHHDTSEPPKGDDAVIKNGRKRRSRATSPTPRPIQQEEHGDAAPKDQDNFKKIVKKRRKRKEEEKVRKRRPRSDSHVDRPSRNRANSTTTTSPSQQHPSSPSTERVPMDPLVAALGDRTHTQGLVQATPAFYYFLGENRWKIERALSKSHRYFNRLSKGNMERNALVAKEAAVWWTKLRPAEYHRYVNMSMHDFEHRIIEWKEDKNVQEMGAMAMAEDWMVEPQTMTDTKEDVELQQQLHHRLYETNSVGHKSFEKDPDAKYNSVLLAALHDVRFHASAPMLSVNRTSERGAAGDPKTTHVHGPIATSVGDECLGCARGWSHHCPVLQHRLPAVKRRAKSQPGLSSLIATRVGLGLQPRQPQVEHHDGSSVTQDDDAMEWRNSHQRRDLDNIMPLASFTLTDPSARADDIALFIEEALALAIPNPPEPSLPNSSGESEENSYSNERLYKCGRCRQVTTSEDGCVECRRAQLVSHSTKHRNSEKSGNLLVRTTLLGRVHSKEKTVELPEGDRAIAKKMLKQNWLPVAVLPPQSVPVPRPSIGGAVCDSEVEKSSSFVPGAEHRENELADIDVAEALATSHDMESEKAAINGTRSDHLSHSASMDLNGAIKNTPQSRSIWTDRAVSIACAGMFFSIVRRDPLRLLAELVATVSLNGSNEVVKHKIGLEFVRDRILKQEYGRIEEFLDDVRRVCQCAVDLHPRQPIYRETANEITNILSVMEDKTKHWIVDGLNAQDTSMTDAERESLNVEYSGLAVNDKEPAEPALKQSLQFPNDSAMQGIESWLTNEIRSDFIRNEENEVAYYASLAIRRAAVAAEASLAPYPNLLTDFRCATKRSHADDEAVRELVDVKVAAVTNQVHFTDVPSHRESNIIRMLHNVRNRRQNVLRSHLDSGCSRCNQVDDHKSAAIPRKCKVVHKELKDCTPRVDSSRRFLSTGMGSDETCKSLASDEVAANRQFTSARKSDIHGLGLFADKEFKEGDVVCEYNGEYCSALVAEARKRQCSDRRQPCYQFWIDENLVLDATRKGGLGRYINHSCHANCLTKIVAGEDPVSHLKRVLVIACKLIAQDEEITYDYDLPIELDLTKRVPCRCRSPACRGFMNWPCPEASVPLDDTTT